MKKELAKCGAFGFFALAPLWLLMLFTALFSMYFMDNEYPYWRAIGSVYKNAGENYDIISLGDSFCNGAIVADLMPAPFHSLAMGGTTPIENYYVLKTYLKNHNAPKKCIISFRNFHLIRQDCFYTRALYFNQLNIIEELEIFTNAYRFCDKQYLELNHIEKAFQYKFRYPAKYLPALINAQFVNRKLGNEQLYSNTLGRNGRYIAVTDNFAEPAGRAADTDFSSFGILPIHKFYLKKTLDLLLENGVEVYLEMAPFNEVSLENIKDNVKQELMSEYQAIQDEYPTIHVNNALVVYPDEYFTDGHHLNNTGAKFFTQSLVNKF